MDACPSSTAEWRVDELTQVNGPATSKTSSGALTSAAALARNDATFWGHLVETCVGAHLINTAPAAVSVRYWRESPHEVDFVLQQGERICAVEVKSSAHNQSARKGLRAFAEKHEKLNVRTAVLGGDDFALADALTHTASHWLQEP